MAFKTSQKKKIHKKRSGTKVMSRRRHTPNVPQLSFGPRIMKGPFGRFDDSSPFPPRLRLKMRYDEIFNLSSVANQAYLQPTYKFGLNCLFDPYLPLGGNSPNGYTKLLGTGGTPGPYARYKVLGGLLTVTLFDPSIDTGAVVGMAIHDPVSYGATNTIGGLTYSQIKAMTNTKTQFVSNTGSQTRTIKQKFSIQQLSSLTKVQFNADLGNFTGAYNGNPASIVMFEIGLLDTRAGAAAVTMQASITIDYFVELYDRYDIQ